MSRKHCEYNALFLYYSHHTPIAGNHSIILRFSLQFLLCLLVIPPYPLACAPLRRSRPGLIGYWAPFSPLRPCLIGTTWAHSLSPPLAVGTTQKCHPAVSRTCTHRRFPPSCPCAPLLPLALIMFRPRTTSPLLIICTPNTALSRPPVQRAPRICCRDFAGPISCRCKQSLSCYPLLGFCWPY